MGNSNSFHIAEGLLLLFVFISYLRYRHMLKLSRNWPQAKATVLSGQLEPVCSAVASRQEIQLMVFSYSYSVAGEFFGGGFSLEPYIVDIRNDELKKRIVGKTLVVAYSPKDPSQN